MGAPVANRHAHLTPALAYAARGLCIRIARIGRGARGLRPRIWLFSPLPSCSLAPPAPRQEWRRFPHLPHWPVSLPYEHPPHAECYTMGGVYHTHSFMEAENMGGGDKQT